MPLERWVTRAFDDGDPAHFGTGWISGTLSVFLGVLSILAVLCLRYPGVLVTADARSYYPLGVIRAVLELTIGLAFLLGFVSALLRRRRVLAVTGMSAALLAVLLGGAQAPLGDAGHSRYYLGLDWFVLTLLVLTAVFVPMERLFPLRLRRVEPRVSCIFQAPTGRRLRMPRGATARPLLLVQHRGLWDRSRPPLVPRVPASVWGPSPADLTFFHPHSVHQRPGQLDG